VCVLLLSLLVTKTAVIGRLRLSKEGEGGGEGGVPRSSLVRALVAVELRLAAAVEAGLGGAAAVLVVVDLALQPVGGHAALRRHLVGAHLQGDGGPVAALQVQLLVVDVPPGPRGRHAGLGRAHTHTHTCY